MEFYHLSDLNIFLSLILLMIIIIINTKQTYKSHSTRIFRMLCWSVIAILLTEVAFWILEGSSYYLAWISTFLYFILEPMPMIIWLCYLDFDLNQSMKRLRKRLYYLQFPAFILILLLVSIPTGILYTIDVNGRYHRGPLVPVVFIMNFGILVFTLIMAFRYRKNLEKKTFSSIVMFSSLPIAGGIMQLIFFGTTLLWDSVALSVIYVYLFLETRKEIRDYLTGLLNRQQIDDIIQTRIADYPKKGGFSVLMLDMNGFKNINDRFGHKEGDRVLVRVAELLYNSVKKIDSVGRFGGDEFIILLEEENSKEIENVIKRIHSELDRENTANTRPYRISLSCGYAVYSPAEHKDFIELLSMADEEMYSIKKAWKKITHNSETHAADRR